jgi:hypothetical protein
LTDKPARKVLPLIFRSAVRKVHWTGVSSLIQLSLSLPCLGQRIPVDIIGSISNSGDSTRPITGGPNQPQVQAQFITNFVDFQMNIRAALDAPRFMSAGGCVARIEERIPAMVRQQLASRGHRLGVRPHYSYLVGPGQVVLHDSAANVNYGASDPRGEGLAGPESPAFLPFRGPQ